jgi:RecB family exonuclease
LELDPDAYTLFARADLDAGSAYHRAFERIYRRIRDGAGTIRASEADSYMEWVDEAVAWAMEGWASRESSLSPAEIEALTRRLEESLRRFIPEDASRFDGHEVEDLEGYYAVEVEGGGLLGGYVDRLLRDPTEETISVTDYKKGNLPSGTRFALDEAGEIDELQLPLYAEILERLGMRLSGLYLYSVEHTKHVTVYGSGNRPYLDEEGMAAAREAAMGACRSALSGIRAGDFRFPDPELGCEACRFRGICRVRFATG